MQTVSDKLKRYQSIQWGRLSPRSWGQNVRQVSRFILDANNPMPERQVALAVLDAAHGEPVGDTSQSVVLGFVGEALRDGYAP